jgi:hypothetical protein
MGRVGRSPRDGESFNRDEGGAGMAEKNEIPLREYSRRFGTIAIAEGYVSPERVKTALEEQRNDALGGKSHRVLGAILFEKGWITPEQIDAVLKKLFDPTA